MQLLQPSDTNRNNTRQEQLKQVCYDLQKVSQKLNCGLILGCQFNRVSNNALKLHANNISEAGDIERNASLIIGICDLNRKTVIDKQHEPKEFYSRIFRHLGYTEKQKIDLEPYLYIEILKNRNGNPNLRSLLKKDNNTGFLEKSFKKNKEKTDPSEQQHEATNSTYKRNKVI